LSRVAVEWRLSSRITGEVSDAPDLKDVMARAGGVAEVADAGTGAAGFDGGLVCWVPDDHDVSDLVGPKVGVLTSDRGLDQVRSLNAAIGSAATFWRQVEAA
jgi:hypothetical protein